MLSCHLELNHNSPFLAPTMGLEGLEQVMDRPEHVRGDLYLLTAAGHSGGSGVPKSSLPDPHHTLFFMLYLLKAGVGSCCLLGSAVISGV